MPYPPNSTSIYSSTPPAPFQNEPQPISSIASPLAEEQLNTTVGTFYRTLCEDTSGNCPVCRPRRADSPNSAVGTQPPYARQIDSNSSQSNRSWLFVDINELSRTSISSEPQNASIPASALLPFCSQECRELAVCICIMLDGCLQSRVHDSIMLGLRDTLAQKALNVMQQIADKSTQHQRHLRRLLIRLAKASDRLPAVLFLDGVRLLKADPKSSGGFANVYRGRYNHQDVAVKCLRVFRNTNPAALHELKQAVFYETLIWKNTSHRNIVPFFGVTELPEGPSMVSMWMRHDHITSKAQYLLAHGYQRNDLYYHRYMYKWLYEIALGLEYLHGEGIVHGDLRGPNILIDEMRVVRLADFGLAVVAEAQSREQGSTRGGNERWMAPELINPELFELTSDRPTFASDIFSFGCVCIEMYTAHAPYFGLKNNMQVINSVPNGRRPLRSHTIDSVEVTIPIELWWIAEECWVHDPQRRPSIQYIIQELEQLQIPWVSSVGRQTATRRPTGRVVSDAGAESTIW